MRFRGLLIAIALLALLGGGVYWSNKTKDAGANKPAADAPPKIVAVAEDQVRRIAIAKTGSEAVVVEKNAAGKWEITAPRPFAADPEAVGAMTSALASLSADRVIEEKAADPNSYGLGAPGLKVTVSKKNGQSVELLVGDETPTGGGFFAMVQGNPRVVTIASFNKTSLDKTASDLRDKRLLTFDSDKIVRLELDAKKQSIEFGKNAQGDWRIVKPRVLRADGGQIEDLVRKLKDAKMDLTVPDEDAKKAAAAFQRAPQGAAVKVTDSAGAQQLQVRQDKDKNYYAKSTAVEGVHKIASDLGEALGKGLDDLRNKKLFDFGWNEPSKIELRDGAKQLSCQKSGEKWTAGAKQLDSSTVQTVIDKLRDLAATRFADKGFTTASVEAGVTWNDGKRTEKVSISVSGANGFAVRENEPGVYEIDAKAVEELRKAIAEVKEAAPPKNEKKK